MFNISDFGRKAKTLTENRIVLILWQEVVDMTIYDINWLAYHIPWLYNILVNHSLFCFILTIVAIFAFVVPYEKFESRQAADTKYVSILFILYLLSACSAIIKNIIVRMLDAYTSISRRIVAAFKSENQEKNNWNLKNRIDQKRFYADFI